MRRPTARRRRPNCPVPAPPTPCSLANFFVGDPNLKQVVAHTVEAGLRGSTVLGDGRLTYNAGFYRSELDNDIEFVNSVTLNRAYFTNVGQTQRQGVDAGNKTRRRAGRHFSPILTPMRLSQRLRRVRRQQPGRRRQRQHHISPGDRLPGIPAHQIKFGGTYNVTDKWTVGANAIAQTGSYLFGDEANLTPQLPGYFTLNLSTSYQIAPHFQLFGSIENVTNASTTRPAHSRRPPRCPCRRRRTRPTRAPTARPRRSERSAACGRRFRRAAIARADRDCRVCCKRLQSLLTWSQRRTVCRWSGTFAAGGRQGNAMTMECHASGRIVPACAPRYQWAQVALLAAALASLAAGAAHAACPGYSTCPAISYPQILKSNSDAIAIATGIETSEEAALAETTSTTLTAAQRTALIGNLVVFDRRLSVNQNQACMSCHTAGAGFTGGISRIDAGTLTCAACHGGGSGFVGGNASAASFPGSATTRTGNRKPMSLATRPSRRGSTTTVRTSSAAISGTTAPPASSPAAPPPTRRSPRSPTRPKWRWRIPACVVYRVATGAYAGFFTQVYGAAALDIDWPANAATICSIVNDGAANQTPLHLSATGRANSTATFHLIGLAVAAFEASPAVSPFSSKFERVPAPHRHADRAGGDRAETVPWQGEANDCHVSTGPRPMLTNFTSVNIGIPANPMNPFFLEKLPDRHGDVANPAGDNYVDPGLGGFLTSTANTNPAWQALAPQVSRHLPGGDPAQRRRRAARRLFARLHAQRLLHRPADDRALLQHPRRAGAARDIAGGRCDVRRRVAGRRRSRPTSTRPRPATSS